MDEKKTLIEFPCPFSVEEKYAMVCSGEFGAFEMISASGALTGYRGFRKGFGTTGIYDNFKDALEAAMTKWGNES